MIQPIKSQTILDVFRKQSQLDKEMEQARLVNILSGHINTIKGAEAQYAPQMSQEELKKIQLFNMIEQAKAKYAEQNERASLQDILAGTNVKNQTARNWQLHNQYLPREKEAAIKMAEMKNQYYPVEMQDKRNKAFSYIDEKQKKIEKLTQDINNFLKKEDRAERKTNAYVDNLRAGIPLTEQRTRELETKNKYGDRQQAARTMIDENQAQYAQPMSEANLQGRQLTNQKQQITNHSLNDMLMAKLSGLKSSNIGKEIANIFAPDIAKGNIESTRLGNEGKVITNQNAYRMNEANFQGKQLDNQLTAKKLEESTINNKYLEKEKQLSQDMKESQAKYEKFKAEHAHEKLKNETMKAESYSKANSQRNLNKKNAPKIAQIQSQLNELKETGIDPANGKQLSGRQLEDQTNNYRMALDDAVVSPDDERFLSTIGMNMDLFSEINKRQIAQNYGLFAKIKMGAKNIVKPLGYNEEVLNRFDQFLNQVAPTSAESMRFAFKGSIQPSNLKKWYDQIVPKAWNNPQSALSHLIQFEKQMHDETRSRLKNVPRDGYYRQVRFRGYHLIPGDIQPEKAEELSRVAKEILAYRGLK